ncbi:NUDIX domain protein [Mycobacteroides franklinii]|uniref:NUDIX domain protein n=2 Tax=Mycobacteroides franklinii TaxID=948102 RepID=A0A4R8R589_9MYCO|nr:NUDIX domain protein [Mycobacteroides franklinii]TDZ50370.1 NUDIX domain protein [Mycobacteroides franklinii]TDZ56790.1 NUDIX domain protein [Mycobacteroides franklinii]TDZ63731.1 NUDIX domain protein [Mycobacteroides franklinii]TDZ70128.1 NUDIX domain protein [Mycobacteroides franklinii]
MSQMGEEHQAVSGLRASTVELLSSWEAPDAEQDSLRHSVLAFLDANPDACRRRSAAGHITASALVVNHDGSQALLTLHPRVGKWLQLGGHCEEEDSTIWDAALREATEESGIADLTLEPNLLGIHVHPITCSLGVPTRHLDLQFLAHAPEGAQISVSEESLDLRWWPIDRIPDEDHSVAVLAQRARTRLR